MKHVMLDCETLGLAPGNAVRSIGACFFKPVSPAGRDPAELIGEIFYRNVTRESCEARGLTVDLNTVAWWERQSAEAQEMLLKDQVPLDQALWELSAWWDKNGAEYVWSHGANFDQPLLEACYRVCGMQAPWQYYNSRCTRTVYDMARLDTRDFQFTGVKHHALDDAIHQAKMVQVAVSRLFPPAQIVQKGSDDAF